MNKNASLIIITLIFVSFACETKEEKPLPKHKTVINPEAIKQQFIEANKLIVQKESDEMDYYAKSHKMNFVKTSAGIRYFVYKASEKGDSLRDNSMVALNYTVSLLDRKVCYKSD
jgi:hypothetical protein